jgi:Leucine-rich repeat (LRR) protein
LKYNNQIQILSVAYNKLTFLSNKLLREHTTITEFFFGFNRIQKVPGRFFNGLTNLARIHLNYNKLETIDYNLFQGLTSLKTLRLNGNPLTTKMNGAQLLSNIHSVCGCTITLFSF